MGAWSAAPFGNDRALDLLEELAELDDLGKSDLLGDVFREGLASVADNPPLAHEVVAAAALIALALPGGLVSISRHPAGDDDGFGDFDPADEGNAEEEWTPALLRSPEAGLIGQAIAAVLHVTGADSEWRSVWMLEADRDEAIERVALVVAVLERAAGGQP
ncbi:DUF4259 domain-containing protein [Catellatospora sp. NPDC049133]|jgi:hypothetical protein|uniref:DUF4259 domain-containing protein n=1 Tax=Catellatospora sp. NPDC049133 TaxID=3155499 RepID=UPI0033D88D36